MYCYRISAHKNTMKFDPLPCFWKCALSTAHLCEVKIETGGEAKRERERAGAHLGGKRESHGQYFNHKSCPLVFSVDESKILCGISLPVWDALE